MANRASSLSPFPAMTPTDHRLWLWITIVVCMGVSILSLCLRLGIRYRRYGLDDLAMVLCFIFVMAHASVLIAALHTGFGVTPTPETQAGIFKAAKLVFAARPLLSSALCSSKASAILLLRRLVPRHSWRTWVCDTALLLTIFWAIAAILTTSLGCFPSHPASQNTDESCPGIQARITTTIALNMATEIVIFGLAITCSRSFEMTTKSKYQVLIGYSLRFSIIAISAAYLTSSLHVLQTPATPTTPIPPTLLSLTLSTTSLLCPLLTSLTPFPLPIPPPVPISTKKPPRLRRLSTPMSFFADRMRGDREVFKHKASVFATDKGTERESEEGIFRLETFVITTKRYSEGASTVLGV